MKNLDIFKITKHKKTWNKDLLISWHHWHLILTGLDMAQSRLHVLYLVNNGPINGSWDVWMDIWKLASWLAGSVSSIVHWDGGFQMLLPRAVIHWSWRFSPFKRCSCVLRWVETIKLKGHQLMNVVNSHNVDKSTFWIEMFLCTFRKRKVNAHTCEIIQVRTKYLRTT